MWNAPFAEALAARTVAPTGVVESMKWVGMNANRFTGNGVLITGGTSGLGAAAARVFVAKGAQVVIAGRNRARGEAVAAELGQRVRFVETDVAVEADVQRAVDAACDAPHGLRVALSAAGAAVVAKTIGRDGPHSLEAFRRMLEVNLVGSFNVLRLAAHAMSSNAPDPEGARGVIVVTSSIGASEGQMGQVAYAAAKGGVSAMVLPAARDLARNGIRVVGVAPGVFDTPFMDVLSDAARQQVAEAVPFPTRLGRADEFAELVAHIASNVMLNGEVIRIDGALRLGPR